MSDPVANRLSDLLLAWEEARDQGVSIDPASLCPDDPALLAILRERIHALDAMSSVLNITVDREQEATRDVIHDSPATQLTQVEPVSNQPSPFTHTTQPKSDTLQLPGFTILGKLGRGGMGIVYKARQDNADRIVAIKMILAGNHASEGQRKRFETEARLIAKLNHPNIIQLYDVDNHEGFEYLVMEYADAGNFDSVLRHGPLEPLIAAKFMETVARAIDHAHQKGIIHRDLKPANILLGHSTIDGSSQATAPESTSAPPAPLPSGVVPKITDFGLARHLESDERLTQTGYAVGTPAYMSPEQARRDDDAIGPASDIFSLGVILYQSITGKRPFDARTDWELMGAIVRNEPVAPSRVCPTIPADLEAICLKCLRKRPGERYCTASELADDLKRFREGQPTKAGSISRRRWLIRAGTGLAAGLGVAGYFLAPRSSGDPVHIGVIQPLANSAMEKTGQAVRDAVDLAAAEWNARGGILGREIILKEGDSGQGARNSVAEARRLIEDEHVACIIGGSSSIERLLLQEVAQGMQHLMFFPTDFEGMDDSEYVYHIGAVPNQLHLPVLTWWRQQVPRKRYFVIGVGTLYTGAVATQIDSHLTKIGAELVGVGYADVGSYNFDRVVHQAIEARAEALIVLIRGNEGLGLFDALRFAELDVSKLPVMWFGISEQVLGSIAPHVKNGHYLGSTYFQNIDCPINRAFLDAYRQRHGTRSVPSDAMDGAYTAVHLWAQAAIAAGSIEPNAVRPLIRQQKYTAPGGPIRFSERYNFVYRHARAGRFDASGVLREAWRSQEPIAPEPFPPGRTPEEWRKFRDSFRRAASESM